MALVIVGIQLRGWGSVHEVPDTQSYLETARMSPAGMLASFRSVGYPIFLRTVLLASPRLAALPQIHLAFHFLAVAVFFRALVRFGATRWQAFAAASPILWTVLHDPAIPDVGSDSLARSMAVITISLLLIVSATPRRLGPWIGLTLCLAATYHVRPAHLFLVPLVPCLGFLALAIHAAWHAAPFPWKRQVVSLAAVSVLPFLAFCLMRWAVVGHFGLVSCGGWNLPGITVELLDRPAIENHFPEDLRPMALQVLAARDRMRREHGLTAVFCDGRASIAQLHENYNLNLYEAAIPVVRRWHGESKTAVAGPSTVAVNDDLMRLAWYTIKARKLAYLRLVIDNYRYAVADIPNSNTVLSRLAVLAAFLWVVRNLALPRGSSIGRARRTSQSFLMQLAIVIGTLYAAMGLLPIVLVEEPLGRYLIAIAVFLCPICGLWILQEIEQIAARLRFTYRRLSAGG